MVLPPLSLPLPLPLPPLRQPQNYRKASAVTQMRQDGYPRASTGAKLNGLDLMALHVALTALTQP